MHGNSTTPSPLLNLPAFPYTLRYIGNRCYIFDVVRKKYVYLTAEEWVRQHFLHYLMHHLSYPKALIRLEGGIVQQSRPDIVVYSRSGSIGMLVECKAAHRAVTTQALYQLIRYNVSLQARVLVVTNGLQHFCWQVNKAAGCYEGLSMIPDFHAEYVSST